MCFLINKKNQYKQTFNKLKKIYNYINMLNFKNYIFLII